MPAQPALPRDLTLLQLGSLSVLTCLLVSEPRASTQPVVASPQKVVALPRAVVSSPLHPLVAEQ
jgi:hypothetical protein